MPEDSHSKMKRSIGFLIILLLAAIGIALTVGGATRTAGTASYEILVGLGVGFLSAAVIALLYELFASQAAETVMRRALAEELNESRPALLRDASALGIDRMYRTRGDALKDFEGHLSGECERVARGERAELWVTCTSMRGFFFEGNIADNIIRTFAQHSENATLRILMTHPEHTASREMAERRTRNSIAGDIRDTLKRLEDRGVDLEQCVRLFRGSPTIFGMATETRMLLNPYPHGAEGQSAFALIAVNVYNGTGIYTKFYADHFVQPWKRSEPVDQELVAGLDPRLDLRDEARAEAALVPDAKNAASNSPTTEPPAAPDRV